MKRNKYVDIWKEEAAVKHFLIITQIPVDSFSHLDLLSASSYCDELSDSRWSSSHPDPPRNYWKTKKTKQMLLNTSVSTATAQKGNKTSMYTLALLDQEWRVKKGETSQVKHVVKERVRWLREIWGD